MRKIKKGIFFILIIMLIVGSFIGGKIVFNGYFEYKEAITKHSIEFVVDEIQKGENYTEIHEISEDFLVAIVAIEDRRFLNHKGIDYKGLARALVRNLQAGEIVEGGSTITQQLAKNLYFSSEQNINRKIAELFLAKDIEELYSKEEILELYVNIIYYGNDSYGIYQATKGYFDKEPSELTYDEATLLAGVPQAPSVYDLTKNLEGAREKQKYVEKAINEIS